ncbi:MAG: LLM class flavin-dependent oxidoreductase, partial [Chloroflexi bacterium]|nr:LLM class flavin-dependent oxidoreductase [Chloroflexota bacterium]
MTDEIEFGPPVDVAPTTVEEAAGYTDFWTQEVRGFDALTPLAALALQAPRARLGAAIAGVYTRGPALL